MTRTVRNNRARRSALVLELEEIGAAYDDEARALCVVRRMTVTDADTKP